MSSKRLRYEQRRAFTISELLVLIGTIAILMAVFLPLLDRNRGPARRAMCQMNMRQIALAAINYHDAQLHYPSCNGVGKRNNVGSSGQLSLIYQILPFMDDIARQQQISQSGTFGGKLFPAYPPLNSLDYEPWTKELPILLCSTVPEFDTGFAKTHYGFCIGDRARNIASPKISRGGFAGELTVSQDDIGDGSSNTMMLAEIGARTEASRENRWAVNRTLAILDDPSLSFDLITQADDWRWFQGVPLSSSGRGAHWADGRAGVALFNTILPPNSPSSSVGRGINDDGIYSASSPHPGGVNIARFDGSISFIEENIDAGDSKSSSPTEEQMINGVISPYGVWGAMGTINGGDVVGEF